MMDQILAGLTSFRVYLYGFMLYFDTIEELHEPLKIFLERESSANLQLKISKYFLVQRKVDILGHVVD